MKHLSSNNYNQNKLENVPDGVSDQDAVNIRQLKAREVSKSPVQLIAHRGFAKINVENTIVALQSALSLGADAIEFDIQTSSTGTPHLFHDLTLNSKTSGTNALTTRTDPYIAGLKYTIADGSPLEGIGIPTLESAMAAISNKEFTHIQPEIKLYSNQTADITEMHRIVKKYIPSHKTLWLSFNISDLTVVNSLDDQAGVGFLISPGTGYTSEAQLISAIDSVSSTLANGHVLAHYSLWLDYPSTVEYAKGLGVGVGGWTVPNEMIAEQLIGLGVHLITADTNMQEIR